MFKDLRSTEWDSSSKDQDEDPRGKFCGLFAPKDKRTVNSEKKTPDTALERFYLTVQKLPNSLPLSVNVSQVVGYCVSTHSTTLARAPIANREGNFCKRNPRWNLVPVRTPRLKIMTPSKLWLRQWIPTDRHVKRCFSFGGPKNYSSGIYAEQTTGWIALNFYTHVHWLPVNSHE